MNVKFKFTASETPQQNGKVKRGCATLYGKMQTMLPFAGCDDEMKRKIWEAAATATKLDNIMNKQVELSPYCC